MPEAVGVCQSIRRCYTLRANITLTQVALRITLHPDNLIIFYADQKGTAAVVHPGAMCPYPANVIFHPVIYLFELPSALNLAIGEIQIENSSRKEDYETNHQFRHFL
jgi:hypothetical protein